MCARTDQPDQPDQRDRAIERLLVQDLKFGLAPGPCPDPDLVAAYAEQGIAAGEKVELEVHFAVCERCQQVLVALGTALEAPAGVSVAVMPAPVAVPVPAALRPAATPVTTPPARSPQRWLWLSPAFGVAAAALLWMALRPAAPEPVQTAADYSRIAEQETRAMNAPAAPSAQPEAPAVVAPPDAQALDRLAKTEKEIQADARERAIDQFEAPSADSAPAALAAPSAGPEVAAIPPPAPAASDAPLAARQREQVAGTRGNASGAASQPGSYSLAMLLRPNEFSSPDGSVTWRLGSGDRIDRSTDQGRTWVVQETGGTGLVSGAANSTTVAWVVGRAGRILCTTDGATWKGVAPPQGSSTIDWVGVEARGAWGATITAADGRRFSTTNAGDTWIQQ